jgi:hypothetical protein
VLPYGYERDRIAEAQAQGEGDAAGIAADELILLNLERIKKWAGQFRIEGLTPLRVEAIAISAFRKAIKDYDPRFVTRCVPDHAIPEDGEGDAMFRRFSMLVVRRHLSNAMKDKGNG